MMGDGGRLGGSCGRRAVRRWRATADGRQLWKESRVIAPLLHCTGALRLLHCAAHASSQVLTQAQRPPPVAVLCTPEVAAHAEGNADQDGDEEEQGDLRATVQSKCQCQRKSCRYQHLKLQQKNDCITDLVVSSGR